MSASRPAVAITGIGAVSPFGVGRTRFWNAILAGESGVTAFDGVDERHWTSRVAARVGEDAIALAEASLNGQYLGADGRADPKRYAKVSRIAVTTRAVPKVRFCSAGACWWPNQSGVQLPSEF